MLVGALISLTAAVSAAPFSLSVDNRVGKRAYVAAEVSSYAAKPAPGIRAAYFLSPDTMVELAHARIAADRGGEEFFGSATDLGYKTFFTNSLYAAAGFNHQTWTVDDKDYGRTAGSIQFGNQWQWSAVTAGCDWLGYLVPLAGAAPVASTAADRLRFVRAYAGYAF